MEIGNDGEQLYSKKISIHTLGIAVMREMLLTATDSVSGDISVSAGDLRWRSGLSDMDCAKSESDDGGKLSKSHWMVGSGELSERRLGCSC